MKKFKIITLGCKVNQAESEALGEALATPDWQPAEASEAAELYIINTCAVTQKAAMQWVFTPAMMNNGPVAVWAAVPFRFKLNK